LRRGQLRQVSLAEHGRGGKAIADLAQQTTDIEILDAVRCLTGLLLILALIVAMRNLWALAAVEHTPTDESVRNLG
jgi:hypothetical protein